MLAFDKPRMSVSAVIASSTTTPRDMGDNAGAAFTLSPDLRILSDSGVSPSRPSAHQIEPGRYRERTDQGTPFELSRAGMLY
jgi:hypothetical protein